MATVHHVFVYFLLCMTADVSSADANNKVHEPAHAGEIPEPLGVSGEQPPEALRVPALIGKFPEPWNISKIGPEIVFFRRGKEKTVVGHDSDEEAAAASLDEAGFLSADRIVFITHGFLSSLKAEWLHEMKDAMIAERDQTVAILGWGGGADIGVLKYPQAAANALAVGEWLAGHAAQIRRRRKDICIWGVGHSLGAHLMGCAGRTSGVFDRVTGLDPAGPGFQKANEDKRLRRGDAKLVDVIHTDGKRFPYFGTLIPLGDIDFYPNYGWGQPRYSDIPDTPEEPDMVGFEYAESSEEPGEDIDPYCMYGSELSRSHSREEPASNVDPYCMYGSGLSRSHSRAIDYFTWSISNKARFVTNQVLEESPSINKVVRKLKSVADQREMGYHADEDNSGKSYTLGQMCYYLATNTNEPWA